MWLNEALIPGSLPRSQSSGTDIVRFVGIVAPLPHGVVSQIFWENSFLSNTRG